MKAEQIQPIIERLRAAGKDEALRAEVWQYLDDLEVTVTTEPEKLEALRARLGEDRVRAVVPLYIVFHRKVLDELAR